MQLASLSLILTALHASVRVDCRLTLQHLQRHQYWTGRLDPGAGWSTGSEHFYVDLSESMKNGLPRGHLVILPVTTPPKVFVVIFDLRRNRFLCMNIKGQLYNSRQKDRKHCLFIWFNLAENHDLFSSVSGNWSIKLGGGGLEVVRRGPPEGSSALLERVVKRQRRSEKVNPSDPLRTEYHPAPPAKDPEQNQAGAVSKETITSCDDPLRVLRPNGHGSPVKTNIADRAEHE
ncbi:hypothetical protein ATANTOWER_019616 [Ataeniobius toweri]|uniref:Fibroblast growth factor 23 n=1 Tax=Ataeniobius toweri TaxID=208326 RepID=A0ABU7A798_9TELE|nr:hypothetical protein [Ataeniobius toweri]